MPENALDLRQLYERTLSLFSARNAITRALDWVDQIIPVFANACHASLQDSTLEPIDRWLDWVDSERFQVIEEAGKGTIYEWRRSWLKILLTTTRTLKQAAKPMSGEERARLAYSLWTQYQNHPACFPRAFWHDLIAYLDTPLLRSSTSCAAQTKYLDQQSFPFPLVLSYPIPDGNTVMKVIMAQFFYEAAEGSTGQLFLHPEQAALRCMDAQFAHSFVQATQAVETELRDRFASLPDVRVRIQTIKPAHERLLAGMVLKGPSAGGALAIGLHCLHTGNTRVDGRTAISFALGVPASTAPNLNCHEVAGIDEKVPGCIQQGIRRLILEKEQQRKSAVYARAQGLETVGAETFSEAVSLALSRKIVLLYHRYEQQDQELATRLEARLSARGHRVFIDRNLPVGIEWAKKVMEWIEEADAVIPLLSAQALVSDMLAGAIQAAYDARQKQGSKPRLLPVRVGYEGQIPETLAYILKPLHAALWQSVEDDRRLIEELERSLDREEDIPPDEVPTGAAWDSNSLADDLEPFDGLVPLGSRFYIPRETDREFLTAMHQRHSVILIKGPRQTGKSSLLARGLDQAAKSGSQVAVTDFQKMSRNDLSSLAAFYRAIARMLARQLKIEMPLEKTWIEGRSENINFEEYIEDHVLPEAGNLAWGIDEADRLFAIDFSSDVFGLFRSWANERQGRPHSPWVRLTLAIAYATEAHLFIQDQNQSPFNIGTRLELQDFSIPQVAQLNTLYGSPLRAQEDIERFYRLVGGHPYLVRRGLYAMARGRKGIREFEAEASHDSGPIGDHLRRIMTLLALSEENRQALQEILRGKPCPTYETFYHLRSAGIVVGEAVQEARLRCQLYEDYLVRHLLK